MNTESNNTCCDKCSCTADCGLSANRPLCHNYQCACHQNHKDNGEKLAELSYKAWEASKEITSNPQWEERFLKACSDAGCEGYTDSLKQFIHSLLREERARVVKILEGMRIDIKPIHGATPTGIIEDTKRFQLQFGHNLALTDAIHHITKENE